MLTQENRVLDYWTSKKKRLDQNQQFCLFERSARQSLAWIKEEGDIYLKTHTNVGSTTEETQALLKEHNSFKVFDTFDVTQYYIFFKHYLILPLSKNSRICMQGSS